GNRRRTSWRAPAPRLVPSEPGPTMKLLWIAGPLLALAGCRSTEGGPIATAVVTGRPPPAPAVLDMRARPPPPVTAPVVPAAFTTAPGPPATQAPETGQAVELPSPRPSPDAAAPTRPIDLEGALALAGVDNPTIGLALEAVRAGQAEQLRAQALLLPTLIGGASADWHRGTLQSGRGIIRDVERQSAYVGAGAAAVGAGTVGFPRGRVGGHLREALYEPPAAPHAVAGPPVAAAPPPNPRLLGVAP